MALSGEKRLPRASAAQFDGAARKSAERRALRRLRAKRDVLWRYALACAAIFAEFSRQFGAAAAYGAYCFIYIEPRVFPKLRLLPLLRCAIEHCRHLLRHYFSRAIFRAPRHAHIAGDNIYIILSRYRCHRRHMNTCAHSLYLCLREP